tara:strand:+ start:104 stop:307 length:204 start_codon:yes stop_codon:yes gene_type:complete
MTTTKFLEIDPTYLDSLSTERRDITQGWDGRGNLVWTVYTTNPKSYRHNVSERFDNFAEAVNWMTYA